MEGIEVILTFFRIFNRQTECSYVRYGYPFLFVYLLLFYIIPFQNFLLIKRRHHLYVNATNFNLCLVFKIIAVMVLSIVTSVLKVISERLVTFTLKYRALGERSNHYLMYVKSNVLKNSGMEELNPAAK